MGSSTTDSEPQAKRMKFDQSTNQPVNQPASQLSDYQSVSQSINQSINQSIDEPVDSEPFSFDFSMWDNEEPITPSNMYINQSILAPMVRLNTLPFRLLCRQYGCKVLYSEELIAQKLATCERSVRTINQSNNQSIDIIEYTPKLKPGQSINQPITPTFSTYVNEPIVLQIGASCGVTALQGVERLIDDVIAVDLNMGCPERFSTSGGMGSALLTQPEKVADILSTLRRNISINKPITCKIRMCEDQNTTFELMRRAEKCGISAIAIHARYVQDRPMKVKAMNQSINQLIKCVKLPIIYNGDCFTQEHVSTFRCETGASSLMIGRGAMWNASIFKPMSNQSSSTQSINQSNDEVQDNQLDQQSINQSINPSSTMIPVYDIASQYSRISSLVTPNISNTKYCLLEMIKPHLTNGHAFQRMARAKTHQEIKQAICQLKHEAQSGINNQSISQMKKHQYRRFLYGPYEPPIIQWEERTESNAIWGNNQSINQSI